MRASIFWKSARPRHSLRTSVWVAVAGLLCNVPAMAVDLAENVQLHGFASQAYISTSANNFFGTSDDGSFDFRELGVNLSWQAMPNLQFAAQVNSRKAGLTDDDKPRFDYALMDFTFFSGATHHAGVRLGRHKNPVGFYNLTRDVANTRPSIFLPESIYRDDARSLVLSLDGAQFYGERRSSAGDVFLDIGAGKPILDSASRATSTPRQSYVGRLLYELDGGRLRLALTAADAHVGSKSAFLPNAEISLKTYLVSAQYSADKWGLTVELQPEQKASIRGFRPLAPDTRTVAMSYYVQGTCQIAKDWEVLLRRDILYADKNDKSGTLYAAITGMPAHNRYAKDWTLGLGWKVIPHVLLRAEWHRVNGTAWLSGRENRVPPATKENWDMLAIQASYSF